MRIKDIKCLMTPIERIGGTLSIVGTVEPIVYENIYRLKKTLNRHDAFVRSWKSDDSIWFQVTLTNRFEHSNMNFRVDNKILSDPLFWDGFSDYPEIFVAEMINRIERGGRSARQKIHRS